MEDRTVQSKNRYDRALPKRMLAAALLASLLVTAAPINPASAANQIPKILNYQARITNASGVPVADGNLNIWISVYNASSGGTCLYAMRGTCGTPSFKTVTVVDGVFSTLIGDTAAGDVEIPESLFDNNSLFLGVTVASDTEMVPRKRISAAPYALNADKLDDLDLASSGSTTPYVVGTTTNGNLVITGDPQGGTVSTGAFYLNPAGASASETLFGIADNGVNRWMLDKEGDITHVGSLLATAASSTAQFVFRGAASQIMNLFEVQDSFTNRAMQVSATSTILGATSFSYKLLLGTPTSHDAFGLVAAEFVGAAGRYMFSNDTIDDSIKGAVFGTRPYNTTEKPFHFLSGIADLSSNTVSIGGNLSDGQAATQISFYTTPAVHTAFGTERMRIDASGNVGIGTTAGVARLTVSASATSPLTNIFEVTNSTLGQKYLTAGATTTLLGATQSGYRLGVRTAVPTTTLTVDGDTFLSGHTIIGDQFTVGTSVPSSLYALDVQENSTADGSTGFHIDVQHTPSGSGHTIEGQFVQAKTSSGNSTAIDQMAAYDGQSFLQGSGTANTLWGMVVKAVNGGTGLATFAIGVSGFPAITSSGGITHGIGLYSQTPLLLSTGSVQNAYGLYIEPQNVGAVSNHAIFYNNGLNGFSVRGNGDVGIGNTSPSARLTISASTTAPITNLLEIRNSTNSRRYLVVSATGTTIGAASNTDSVVFNSRVGSNFTPTTDASFDLGDYDRRWRDLWLSGGSAKIALDTSGTSVMSLGFETSQGLRGLIRTPDNIPLQIRSGNVGSSGITVTSSGATISNLTVTGTCTNCSSVSTLQSAYDASTTGTTEIFLSSTKGALTIADSFSTFGANLFEIQDRTNGTGDYGRRYMTVSATSTLLGLNANGTFVSGYKFAIGSATSTAKLGVVGGGAALEGAIFSGGSANILNAQIGHSGYLKSSGGFGTGASDSILGALRLSNTGNLVNIGSVQAGESSLTSGGTFATAVAYTVGSNPAFPSIGDMNGDGRNDLVVANTGPESVSVLLGNGDGTFAGHATFTTGNDPISTAVGDLNGDGKADIATANMADNNVSVLLGNGGGAFATHVTYAVGTSPRSIAMGDVNGDGMPDLATANFGAGNVSVLINRGDGTFATHVTYAGGTDEFGVALGDLNADGKADMVVANLNGGNISVFINNGDGTFATSVAYTTGTSPYSVSIGDLNADSKPDLAVANSNGPSVSVLLGNGNGTFAAHSTYTTGAGPRDVVIGDLSGDGKPDLATANIGDDDVSVLINNGAGTFATQVTYAIGGGGSDPHGIAMGDLNGDGKADLATPTFSPSSVHVLLNVPRTILYAKASNGQVGIGTSSASARLTVADALASPTTNIFEIQNTSGGGGYTSRFLTVSSTSTNIAYGANSFASDTLLNVDFTPRALTATTVSGTGTTISYNPQWSTAVTTPALTGSAFGVSRNNVIGGAFASVLTVSGPVAAFTDGITDTAAGSITHTADVVRIKQSGSNNTGSGLNISGSGFSNGHLLRVNNDGTFTDSTPPLFIRDSASNVMFFTTTPSGRVTFNTPTTTNVSYSVMIAQTSTDVPLAIQGDLGSALVIEDTFGTDTLTIQASGAIVGRTGGGNLSLASNTNGQISYSGGQGTFPVHDIFGVAINQTASDRDFARYAVSLAPTSSSTMNGRIVRIQPTINYASGGAGSYEALSIGAIETALPSGTNYLIRAMAGSAGTTDKFTVLNNGNTRVYGSLQVDGTCTGCGASTLVQAYANSSATGSELYLDSSHGALTIADSFSSFGGNLFEIQDRTNGAGDYSRRYLTVSSTSTNVNGALAVTGNTTLGDASGDSLTLNAGSVSVGNPLSISQFGNAIAFSTGTTTTDGGVLFDGSSQTDANASIVKIESNSNAFDGKMLSLSHIPSNVSADITNALMRIFVSRSLTSATTRGDFAESFKIIRASQVNNAGATFNVSNSLVSFQSSGDQVAGTLNDSSVILKLDQQYAAATGAVLNILNAGIGADIALNTSGVVSIGDGGTLIFKDSAANTLCTITDAGSTGNLTCSGTITGAGGGSTLQTVYATSSATGSELYLDSSHGALTIADSFSTFGGNLFEIQNRTNGAGDYSRRYFTVSSTSTIVNDSTLRVTDGTALDSRFTVGKVGLNVVATIRAATNDTGIGNANNLFLQNVDLSPSTHANIIFSNGSFNMAGIESEALNHAFGTANLIFGTRDNAGSYATRMTIGATSTEFTHNVTVTGTAGPFPDVSGAGTRFMYIPSYGGAIRAGQVTGTQWNSSNTGSNSVAFGYNTTASGYADFAAGDGSTAAGSYSFAFGSGNTAGGSGGRDAATAFGFHTTASGFGSFAAGDTTSATDLDAVAIGYRTHAGGWYSFAGGSESSASAYDSFAFGENATAAGVNSLAIGEFNYAANTDAFVFGTGASSASPLVNAITKSFMVGFNSTTPSLTVRGKETSGSPNLLKITGQAHTSLTAATEASDVLFSLDRNVQFSTGTIANQRAVYVTAPTYGFTGASTITTGATFAISGAPAAGTNASYTNRHALLVESGTATFSDHTVLGSSSSTDETTFNSWVKSNITPSADATYSLGDYNRRWKDLWLSGGSANIAMDTSGTSVMKLGFETSLGNRAVIATPDNMPLQLKTTRSATDTRGIYIDTAGRVGVNTANPAKTLLSGVTGMAINGLAAGISLRSDWGLMNWTTYTDGAGRFFIYEHDDEGDIANVRFVIDNEGDVGIGSNIAPDEELDVNGQIQFNLDGAAGDNTIGACKTTSDSASVETATEFVDCTSTPGDVAEWYPVAHPVQATQGSILVSTDSTLTYQSDAIDPLTGQNRGYKETNVVSVLDATSQPYDNRIVGIVSTSPVQTMGAGVNDSTSSSAPIAVSGRVPTKVNVENGAIKAGDPITSSSVTGVGMKSTKPGMIVGFAVDAWNGPGAGVINVYVQPSWHSGLAITTDGAKSLFNDDFSFLPPAYADEEIQAVASRELSFIGSAWDASSSTAVSRKISLMNEIASPDAYRFSFRNDAGQLLASLNQAGDLSIAGSLTVEGGFDYAETFPATPDLDVGDIVMVDPQNANGYGVKKTQGTYENSAIGVISTKPGFLTGKKEAGTQPVALAGRVPVKVTMESGAINPGDPITSSSTPGQGMKATEAGRVIGIALQGTASDGSILIFVNPSWWNGPQPVGDANAGSGLSVTADSLLDFKNSVLSNVAAIISTNGNWSITSDGILAAKKVETETLQAGDVVLVQSEDKSSASEGVIKDGYDAAVVANAAMKPNSKVFVSFLGDPKGGSWVAEKGEGNFTVHLTTPAVGDLAFEYWIVGVDDRRPTEEIAPEEEPAPPAVDSGSGTEETGSGSGTEEIGG